MILTLATNSTSNTATFVAPTVVGLTDISASSLFQMASLEVETTYDDRRRGEEVTPTRDSGSGRKLKVAGFRVIDLLWSFGLTPRRRAFSVRTWDRWKHAARVLR